MICPYCGNFFFSASEMSGPEPDYEPGIECPECGRFVSDAELERHNSGIEDARSDLYLHRLFLDSLIA
jgi:hypothetical protein